MESTYWKMSDTQGIKVITCPFRISNQEGYVYHGTEDILKLSSKWKEVERQYYLMEMFARRGRCPTPCELTVVRDDRGDELGMASVYHPAIVMQHIHFDADGSNSYAWRRARGRFIERMHNLMTMCDDHYGNIVFNKKTKRFMVIDLGGIHKK
jgi:hypothetical protein